MDHQLTQARQWHCPVCGRVARIRVGPVHCACGFIQYSDPPGLGDRVAAHLGRAGLTTARYTSVKQSVGLKGGCNCAKRQRRLNALGERVTRLVTLTGRGPEDRAQTSRGDNDHDAHNQADQIEHQAGAPEAEAPVEPRGE